MGGFGRVSVLGKVCNLVVKFAEFVDGYALHKWVCSGTFVVGGCCHGGRVRCFVFFVSTEFWQW